MNVAGGLTAAAGLIALVATGQRRPGGGPTSRGDRGSGPGIFDGRRSAARPAAPAPPGRRGHLLPRGPRWRGLADTLRRLARGGGKRQSAHWARASDLRSLTVARSGWLSGPGGDIAGPQGRLVLGTGGGRLLAAEPRQSIIVFGPTQSHKTSGFAVPAILDWEGPVVATSVKTDLLDHTIGHRRELGQVGCFDPSGVTALGSAVWSPLPSARTWPGARRAAASLTEVARTSIGTMSDGDFWYAAASKMLAPLLFAAAVGDLSMHDVVRWVDTQEQTEILALLEDAGVSEALHAAWSVFVKEERQRSSIYTTVETLLEPFAGMAGDDPAGSSGSIFDGRGGRAPEPIDPGRLISGSNTLYLCAPAHDQRRLTPLFVSVLRHIVEHVYDRVARTGRPLDPPLLVVLDEAANIAPLHDLDALASTAAGHGVQLVTIWHDLAQITARFGPRATTVVNNHRAKLFLSGISDPSTVDYASHLIGDEELFLPATTRGVNGGASTTYSPSVRRLAPADSLRRIPPGQAVLVYGGLPPARLRLRTWFDDGRLAAKVGGHAATYV